MIGIPLSNYYILLTYTTTTTTTILNVELISFINEGIIIIIII
jgi:hypothetical protein